MKNIVPKLVIKGMEIPYAIYQGGMGAGVSRKKLTRAVHLGGGFGHLSSAGLRDIKSLERGKKYSTYEAVREEIEEAMDGGFRVGINVMRVLDESYDETIRAAIEAKVSAITIGAGVPKKIEKLGDTALGLIVSSARALKIILRYWKQLPDFIVLEGFEAGGHLGFKFEEIGNPEFALEKLLPEVLEIASKKGNIPVIVAGGIFTKADILKYIKMGASGVQLGTRFAVTEESNASLEYKQAVIASAEKDIIVVRSSPCDFPFRILTSSPMYQTRRPPKCQMGYVLQKDENGNYTICKAHPNNPLSKDYLCICDGLRATIGLARGEPALYTVGSNAYRIKEIITVAELMKELIGN